MDIFNIIAGSASIIALILSIFAVNKVIKIEAKISGDFSKNKDASVTTTKQNIKGNSNIQSGRDINV